LTNTATTTSTTAIFYLKAITSTGDCTVSQIIDEKGEKEKRKTGGKRKEWFTRIQRQNSTSSVCQWKNFPLTPSPSSVSREVLLPSFENREKLRNQCFFSPTA